MLDVSFALPGRGNATLATEQTTFDILTPENLAGESDLKVDDPELLAIELDKSGGTVFSDLARALEEYNRWPPIVTVRDAERVFNRVKASRSSYSKEVTEYQRQ